AIVAAPDVSAVEVISGVVVNVPVVEPTSRNEARSALPAVDDAFTRFDSTRPAVRRAFSPTFIGAASDDNLLLMSLAGRANLRPPDGAAATFHQDAGDAKQVEHLLADWSGLDDGLALD